MGVIVGSATIVTGFNNAVSANWGASPNYQHFYILGDGEPYRSVSKPTSNISVTCYSPSGTSVDVSATKGCTAGGTTISVSGAGCGSCGSGGGASGSWMVTSYSFSKTGGAPGQESFSAIRYESSEDAILGGVIRGTAEGSWTVGAGIAGKALTLSASSGSVSAGGVGRTDTMSVGIVTSVGDATAAISATGQGNASAPTIPVYC
jgi:hypothetical protein